MLFINLTKYSSVIYVIFALSIVSTLLCILFEFPYFLSTKILIYLNSLHFKFEKERGSGTAIECYMKDYNVSEEEAMKKFEEMCEDTWKIMNEERSRLTTIPREILKVILNLARVCEVVYKHRGDGFTDQRRIEAHINAMLMDSMSI